MAREAPHPGQANPKRLPRFLRDRGFWFIVVTWTNTLNLYSSGLAAMAMSGVPSASDMSISFFMLFPVVAGSMLLPGVAVGILAEPPSSRSFRPRPTPRRSSVRP